MHRYNIKSNGLTLCLVTDWLCIFKDADGKEFAFWTECDPLWKDLPAKDRRFATGLGRGTGNADTERNRREAAACIAAIGLRKLQLGHQPDALEI